MANVCVILCVLSVCVQISLQGAMFLPLRLINGTYQKGPYYIDENGRVVYEYDYDYEEMVDSSTTTRQPTTSSSTGKYDLNKNDDFKQQDQVINRTLLELFGPPPPAPNDSKIIIRTNVANEPTTNDTNDLLGDRFVPQSYITFLYTREGNSSHNNAANLHVLLISFICTYFLLNIS